MKHKDDTKALGELAYQAYFGRKNGDGFYFNYDIYPLIKNFSFTDFLATATNTEHGGFLVITDNQYIIGYTAGFGIGTHKATFSRVQKDLTGGGLITTEREVKKLSFECTQKFLTAKITYDYKGINESGTNIYNGSICFNLPEDNTITKEQFEIFKIFYKDYNDELIRLIKKYGINKFNIQYGCIDEQGTKIIKTITSLNELYTYLEKHIDENKQLNINNEIIIGTTPNQKIKKLGKI